jgi:hypothetical protein
VVVVVVIKRCQHFFPCAVFDPKSVITDLETTYTGIVGIRFRKKKTNINKEFNLLTIILLEFY